MSITETKSSSTRTNSKKASIKFLGRKIKAGKLNGHLPGPIVQAMRSWGHFLNSLDSGGGHIAVLLALVVFGMWLDMNTTREAEAHEIIAGAFGALLYSMREGQRNEGP